MCDLNEEQYLKKKHYADQAIGHVKDTPVMARKKTIKERLEDKRSKIIENLADVELCIRFLENHPQAETIIPVIGQNLN